MLLGPEELNRLAEEIRAMHIGYVAQNIGADVTGISEETYRQLVDGGYVKPSEVTDFVLEAYRSGHMKGWVDTTPGRVSGTDVAAMFEDARKRGMPELTPVQRNAVEFARERTGRYIVGLGNRVAADLQTLAIETENEVRREMRAKVATEVTRSIINQETAKKLASRLGDATTDWSRNLERIAVTELETAYQEGWAGYIRENTPDGGESHVAKRVHRDACKSCKRVYQLPSGVPRMFTLDELEANGTNFRKKQAEWKATLGPVHPNCHCVLVHVPAGFVFDDEGNMVPKPKPEPKAA